MSTCPENDLLSLYLDNELSPAYQKQIEEHLLTCEKCNEELNKLKALKQAFKKDSDSLSFTQSQLEESFDRLLIKMSYKKNAQPVEQPVFTKTKRGSLKYILSGVAAAAVVALIIPVRVSKTADPAEDYKPVARTQLVPQQNVNQYSNTVSMNLGMQRMLKEVSGSPTLLNSVQEDRANLACYDVFGPLPDEMRDFNYDEKTKGFSLHFSSPVGNISLEIGN